ncbi:hypothetical protein JIR23_23470 [Bradyrhizobium diazoefficiens]|nr:hypothetical protein [Bradyrhizobium diazoefficiens]QQN62507.1 hypothetical protein JIR23_23470 [Bradyrhizobium diazoefficiens]
MIRRDNRLVEADGILSLQIPEDDIYWRGSISRCALLNAPAGSFSKDIVEVEDYRVIVARHALARFGEER